MRNDKKSQAAARRRTAMLAVTAGIALLTAACGGGSSTSSTGSASGGSTAYGRELAYSRCMRSHGVPNFPDPNSNGTAPALNGIDPNSPAVQAAMNACRSLLPNGGVLSQSQRQQGLSQLLDFSKCMRSHGLPKFPDPTAGHGLDLQGTGISTSSPQFQAAAKACQRLMPTPPSNGVPVEPNP